MPTTREDFPCPNDGCDLIGQWRWITTQDAYECEGCGFIITGPELKNMEAT